MCVCVCVRLCVRQVTALLEQVDANVCKATDSAAELLTGVRTFVAHTKSVNSACAIWMSFFRAFEDEERKRSLSERSLAQSDDTPNLTNELLPSFCGSPRTPSLEDSGRCKRRYEATPDCGASPLRSVKFKETTSSAARAGGVAGTEPAADAAEAGPQEGEDSFSPLSQPNFGLLNLPIPGNLKTECSVLDARLAARCVSPMDPLLGHSDVGFVPIFFDVMSPDARRRGMYVRYTYIHLENVYIHLNIIYIRWSWLSGWECRQG
jgi:hypothetical protein